MDILFLTAETSVLMEEWGTFTHFSVALSKSLRCLGHSVTVCLPYSPVLDTNGLLMVRRLTTLVLEIEGQSVELTVLDGKLASQVDIIAIGGIERFPEGAQKEIRRQGSPLSLEVTRSFLLFARASLELIKQRTVSGFSFDIVHCDGWQTAPFPLFLNQFYQTQRNFICPKTVLTVHHEVDHQWFSCTALDALFPDLFHSDQRQKIWWVEEGITNVDAVTSNSEAHRERIEQKLEESFAAYKAERGTTATIRCGIDYSLWNPAIDPALVVRYDAEDPTHKANCKIALQEEYGFECEVDAPLLLTILYRISNEEKSLFLSTLRKAVDKVDFSLIISTFPSSSFLSEEIDELVSLSRGKIICVPTVDSTLLHRLIAGADIALIPAYPKRLRDMPLWFQRYGALPVAYASHGMHEMIIDCDEKFENGTGFLFYEKRVSHFLKAIERALAAKQSPRWPTLVRQAMKLDLSWDRPARQYEQLYRLLLRRTSDGLENDRSRRGGLNQSR
ncbi:glycogen synthase [Pajaroellobacter abortibovis]|uniref:starch synthase n=1 Tax=Pajaroellobacter abortibovis TaxID=1882918 RepID=A0A1L6MXL3_9BACT|nr:glycogen/starch synthase [Pajaroellobacter abortibovis]APS00222.1 hypothetical protein BCY86_05655 [Pajaroellobacter abortibovis]